MLDALLREVGLELANTLLKNRTEPVKPVIRRGVGIVLTLDYLRKGTTAARLETSREHQQGEP
jgi:hypothetical protein